MKPKSIEKSCFRYKDIWSDKNDLLPELVSISSNKKFIFNCLKCSHKYEQRPSHKTNGIGCPFCSNKKLCGKCEFCLEKSCNIYSSIWSQKNDKTPEQVFLNCNKKFFFSCRKCSHDYYKSPNSKTNGIGCPYCSGYKLCGKCDFCLDKSCDRYKYIWSKKNELKPEQVSISNGTKYFFNCLDCSHSYEQTPANKTNCGNGCPYCSGYKLCGDKSCLFCLHWKTIILKNLYKRTLPEISYVSSKTDIYDNHQFLSNQLE